MVPLCLAIKLETQCIWYKGSTFCFCHCLVLSMEIVASSEFGSRSGLHMTRVLSAMYAS